MDFHRKVVIVTGASSGIGAASAILFAQHGARLTLVGRNEVRLKDVAHKCAIGGSQPLCLLLDLTQNDSCETVVSKTVAKYNRIDVLVNSAGRVTMGSLFDDNIDVFDEMININLRVPYKLMQLALPHLAKTKGSIVNLGNVSLTRVRHGFLQYSVAKTALDKLTKSAAIELTSKGIRVNVVKPGVTRTNIVSNFPLEEDETKMVFDIIEENIKVLEPEEVAKMVVFLASDVCPNVNGAEIELNSGSSLL